MKVLCLLTLLANIFFLMWEYRSGAFTSHKKVSEPHAIEGKEKILLISELKTESQTALPRQNQETQLDSLIPDGHDMEGSAEHSITTTIEPAENHQTQLP